MAVESLLTELTIDDLVNQLGTGKFHYKILLLVYFNCFQETSQNVIPGYILPSLKKEFGLTKSELCFYGTLEFLGFFIASLAIGGISDKFGRRKGIIFFQIIWLISMFLSIFSPNIYVFSFLRCIVSTSFMIVVFSGFSLVSEIWPQRTRGIVLNCIACIVVTSYIMTSLFARLLIPDMENSDWRGMILIYCAILFISIFFNYYILEESPRYDLFLGNKQRAFNTIEKIAFDNLGIENFLSEGKKIRIETWVINFNQKVEEVLEIRKQNNIENNFIYEYKKLFKGPYKQITLTMFFLWTVNCSNHFGAEFVLPTSLSKMLEGTDQHPFTILFYMNAVALPFLFLVVAMVEIKYFGRKKTLSIIFLTMGSGGCFTYFEIFPGPIFWLTLFKLSMQACFMVLYTFTSELYPTHIRVNAIGQSSAISRLGVMVMIWIAVFLSEIQPFLPFFIYGIMGLLAFFVTHSLPYETLNEDLDRVISPFVRKEGIFQFEIK